MPNVHYFHNCVSWNFADYLKRHHIRHPSEPYNQCCGFGSKSGCFSAFWIRIQIRILLSPSRNSKKNLDAYCFVTSFDGNDGNVPSKSSKQINFFFKLVFCWQNNKSITKIGGSGSESGPISQRH